MEAKDFFISLSIFLSVLSITFSVFLIIIHLSIPKLLKHPGEFMLIQNIAQIILDIHWLQSIDLFQK